MLAHGGPHVAFAGLRLGAAVHARAARETSVTTVAARRAAMGILEVIRSRVMERRGGAVAVFCTHTLIYRIRYPVAHPHTNIQRFLDFITEVLVFFKFREIQFCRGSS